MAPRFHSGCQVQVSALGSAGPSNQPLGVSRSTRPSPLTSPEPTPWPAAAVPKSCFFQTGFAAGLLELVPDDPGGHVGQDVGLAVAVQVHEDRGLAGAGQVDLVIGPFLPLGPGVLDPADVLGEVGARHEVGLAVAVDVDRQRGEVVVVGPLSSDVADLGGRPARRLIPGVARDDVELAVAVDVEDPGRLEFALAVDRVRLERWLLSDGGGGHQGHARDEGGNRTGHGHQSLSS